MYCTGRVILDKKNQYELFCLFEDFSLAAKKLKNASLFRLRQNYTSRRKDALSENELFVQGEIDRVVSLGRKRPKSLLSYAFLEKLFRVTENPDFFGDLPMQSAQCILKESVRDMKSFLELKKMYIKDKTSLLGEPHMPYYKKNRIPVTFTNQDCVLYRQNNACYLKLPYTKTRLQIQNLSDNAVLKEVKIRPLYGTYEVLYTYESPDIPQSGLFRSAAVDFGVNYSAGVVVSNGDCVLIDGKALKSANQWFNKQRARYESLSPKTKTHMLDSLSNNRRNFLLDAYHQMSTRIVSFLLKEQVQTLILGHTKYWKQNVSIGKKNDQNFVFLPINTFIQMLTYKAERFGIRVMQQEESYTSKASFLDKDAIPVYGSVKNPVFSGKRISRGLYRSSDGTIIHADINGAGNILRKAVQNAFEDGFVLKKPRIITYDFLHKSNPSWIEAV